WRFSFSIIHTLDTFTIFPYTTLFRSIAFLLGAVALFELIRMKQLIEHFFVSIVALFFLVLFMYPADFITIGTITVTSFQLVLVYLSILLISIVISKNKVHINDVGFLFIGTIYVGTAF